MVCECIGPPPRWSEQSGVPLITFIGKTQCALCRGREGHVRPLHHCNNSDAVQFVPYDGQTYKKQKEDNDENAELALVL